jgi:prolipoprotein diacylglyceryltransferase
MKFHIIAAGYLGLPVSEYYGGMHYIPGHSVVFQSGVNNGIFAMIVMIAILWFFIKRGYLSLHKNNPYLYLVIYCLMQLVWNGLFSPLSHFRGTFPIYFICCLLAFEHMNNYTTIKKLR